MEETLKNMEPANPEEISPSEPPSFITASSEPDFIPTDPFADDEF